MTPYVLLFYNIAFLLILSNKIRTDLFYYLAFLVLVLFAGFRVNVGMDFESYTQIFNDIRLGNEQFTFEPLNMLIINIFNDIGVGNQFIFFIYAIINLSGVFYFIKKLSPSKELSLLMFVTIGIFYFSTFNGIRQWAAISMILFAIVKLLDKKYFQTGAFITLAILFHFSAIIILFILPLLLIRWTLLKVIVAVVLSMFFSEFFVYLVENSQYAIYLNGFKFENTGNPFLMAIYELLLISFLISFGYFSASKQLNKSDILLLNMNIVSIFILLVGSVLKIDFLTVMRVNMYFQIQIIILIPRFLQSIKNEKLKFLFLYIGLVFISFYFFYSLYFNGEFYRLIPYTSSF